MPHFPGTSGVAATALLTGLHARLGDDKRVLLPLGDLSCRIHGMLSAQEVRWWGTMLGQVCAVRGAGLQSGRPPQHVGAA